MEKTHHLGAGGNKNASCTLPDPTPEERANNSAYQRAINMPLLSDEELDEWENAVRSAWRTA